MVNRIASNQTTDPPEVSKPPAPKAPKHPPVAQPKSGELSHDQVTLKSAGNVDREPESQ